VIRRESVSRTGNVGARKVSVEYVLSLGTKERRRGLFVEGTREEEWEHSIPKNEWVEFDCAGKRLNVGFEEFNCRVRILLDHFAERGGFFCSKGCAGSFFEALGEDLADVMFTLESRGVQ
jgi:hypothetical protein